MTEDLLVSVIMPVYNEEIYIREAVESVLDQDHTNLELVIADDCSDDLTPGILKEMAEADPRIRVIRAEKNGGCSAALNLALRNVKGDYVCWLSADDKYAPHMISDSLLFLNENPQYGGCYSRHAFIDENSELIEEWKPYNYDEHEPYFTMICCSNAFCACTFLGEKSVFDKAGSFDEVHKYANDYDYMMKLAAYTDIGYFDKVTMFSRRHPGQVTNEGHNEVDKLRVYENMLYNDEIRESLFEKAGVREDRDFIINILDNQSSFYEKYDCQNEVGEVQRVKKDFLGGFPSVQEADRLCEKAALLVNSGKPLEALQLLNEGDFRYGDKTTLSVLYGMIYFIAGKYDDAKEVIERALNKSPDNKDLLYMMEQIRAVLG